MAHYPHIFTVNRLRLEAHLGFYDEERARPQPVEIDLRLYYPQAPACAGDDHGEFLHYMKLTDAIERKVGEGNYRLIEYLATQLFTTVRAITDAHDPNIRLWLKLTKCQPPLKHLEGGASFVISDLPAGATFPPAS